MGLNFPLPMDGRTGEFVHVIRLSPRVLIWTLSAYGVLRRAGLGWSPMPETWWQNAHNFTPAAHAAVMERLLNAVLTHPNFEVSRYSPARHAPALVRGMGGNTHVFLRSPRALL